MKQTSLFKILASLCSSLLLLVSLNFGGCKSSQPTSPQMQQTSDTLRFSQIIVEWHDLFVSISHHNKLQGYYDTNYIKNDLISGSYSYTPKKIQIDPVNVSSFISDSSWSTGGGGNGIQSYDYSYSSTFRIDTALKIIPSLIFAYSSTESYNPQSCLGCQFTDNGTFQKLQLHNISITTLSDKSIFARIKGADLSTHLDSVIQKTWNDKTGGQGYPASLSSTSVVTISSLTDSSYVQIILKP